MILLAVIAVAADQLIIPLAAALIVAVGGLAVGWRQLTLLGNAPKAELEARTQSIIAEAEDRATARALEALKLALEVTERERDRVLGELERCRIDGDKMRGRLTATEELVARLEEQVRELQRARTVGPQGDQGDQGDQGERGQRGAAGDTGARGQRGERGLAVRQGAPGDAA